MARTSLVEISIVDPIEFDRMVRCFHDRCAVTHDEKKYYILSLEAKMVSARRHYDRNNERGLNNTMYGFSSFSAKLEPL